MLPGVGIQALADVSRLQYMHVIAIGCRDPEILLPTKCNVFQRVY
jgi:hypothetical protein